METGLAAKGLLIKGLTSSTPSPLSNLNALKKSTQKKQPLPNGLRNSTLNGRFDNLFCMLKMNFVLFLRLKYTERKKSVLSSCFIKVPILLSYSNMKTTSSIAACSSFVANPFNQRSYEFTDLHCWYTAVVKKYLLTPGGQTKAFDMLA